MRRLLVRFGAFLVAAVVVLAGLEAGLRLFPELVPIDLLDRFQQDVRLEIAQRRGLANMSMVRPLARDDGGPPLQVMKPFTALNYEMQATDEKDRTTSDALGFCNPGTPDVVAGVDVIAVGDSFTACWAVDPTLGWVAQLGALGGYSTYSMGQGGIGPYEYVQILKQLGLGLHPKIVVMNIYEGNDLRDSVRYHRHVEAASRGETLFQSAGNRDDGMGAVLDNPLGRVSYAYNLAVVGVDRGIVGATKALVPSDKDVDFRYALRFPDQTVPFNVENRDQGEVVFARNMRAGKISPAVFDDALQAFAALGREHGFRPVVAYSPAAYTAYAGFTAFNEPDLGELMGWFSGTLRAYLAERTAALGITFADLTPALQAAAKTGGGADLLYSPRNVHYLPAGHLVVARELARVLQAGDAVRADAGAAP